MMPPLAKRLAFERQLHGETWVDHYHWLRAENWQDCVEDPTALPLDIRQYLEAENEWFEHSMASTKALQTTLLEEMRGRIQETDQSLPDADGVWCYIERYEEGDEYPRFLRYKRHEELQGASCQLLIDFNQEAVSHDYFDCGDVEYSPCHAYLAWGADVTGSERFTWHIRNLKTGEDEDLIEDAYAVSWGSSQYLFYTRLDVDLRPSRVYRHKLGTPAAQDVMVYKEYDTRFFCSLWSSLSGHYVFIGADMDDQSEVWFIPTGDIESMPVIVEPRIEGVEYSVEHQLDRFLILTNAGGAKDFKVMVAPCHTPASAHWREWLPHRPGIMLVDIQAYKSWIMWLERENALPRICFCHVDASPDSAQVLQFDQEAYALSLETLCEFDESVFRFGFESPSTPAQTYAFDMHTGTRKLLKQDILPSGHDADDYTVRRMDAITHDGESVPVTLLYRADAQPDSATPCYLTAYGAYGSSMPATFSSNFLSLVDRGFVCVIAHVRGGQEKGRAWYDDARGEKKQNTFDDVVSVARFLIESEFTGPGRIVLSGASAGGLIVGAVVNQHPYLWAGVVADVPFVDVLNTLIDESLPLTPGEWSQWGNPLQCSDAFNAIRAYSPYDNVTDLSYPPMLVTAGVSDPRVTYWEPAKWVAQHRYQRTNSKSLIFRTNMISGHFGVSGRYASLNDEATEMAFAIKVVGD